MFSRGSRARSRSKERSPNVDLGKKIGYGCALYHDYLVLIGAKPSGQPENVICVFNLKEQRVEEGSQNRLPGPLCVNSACIAALHNTEFVYCYGEAASHYQGFAFGGTIPENNCNSFILKMDKYEDRLRYHVEPAMPGPGSCASVCQMIEGKIFVYDPNTENNNFGSLHSFPLERHGWTRFEAKSDNMRLNEPSHNVIFIKDVLYLLTRNTDFSDQTLGEGESLIEDVYSLNLRGNDNRSSWERVSPSGRTPGALSNISLAEANGMIYVFGLSEEKSVLWIYNINEKEWKQVRDASTLIAGPNQKAVVYKGQLLIIDWGYSTNSVGIQYFSLDDLKFVESSENNKDMCKDQAENFIQDTKNLYNGKLFHDVVFEVEGQQILAHKAILVSRSNYFMKMFTSGMSESHSAKIPIPNMKSHVFKALLQYVYCNEVELDEQLALDLIPTVDEYVMKGLKGLCEKYLCKQLRKDNVVDMLIVADRHEIDELKKACFRFILKNLGNIDENEEMDKLSKSLFIELLKFSTAPNTEKKDKPLQKEDHYREKKDKPAKKTPSNLYGVNSGAYIGGAGGGGGGFGGTGAFGGGGGAFGSNNLFGNR